MRVKHTGKPVYTKRTGRKELLPTVANIPACLIVIEASEWHFTGSVNLRKWGVK